MTGPIVPPWGGRISTAQVSCYLDSRIFCTFSIISKKCFTLGGNPEAKNMEKRLLQVYDLLKNLFTKEIFELEALKKATSYMTLAMEDRVNCLALR